MRVTTAAWAVCAVWCAVLAAGTPAIAEQRAQRRPDAAVAAAAGATPPAGGFAGSATVITAAQIEATGAADITAALALVPALLVEQTGGPGGVATLSLRGSTAQEVLVLLDGRRLAAGQAAAYNLNDLPVPIERIERIEVFPGPATALYGADALGGVVNIVTRTNGTTPAFRAGYGAGADGERRLSGGLQYGVGGVGLRLDGQLRSGDGSRENADFDLSQISAGLSLAPAPWGVDLRYATLEHRDGAPGTLIAPTPLARRRDDRDLLRADFTYQPGGGWGVRSGVFSESRTLRFEDPAAPATADRATSRSRGADAQWSFETGAGEVYTIGGEWVDDRMGGAIGSDYDAERWGLFAQDHWRAGAWSAVGAIRRDEHSVYGSRTSPSLTLAWQAAGWKLWGSWGRGYRVPGFEELFANDRLRQGNPDLLPESSLSYEGGGELGNDGSLVRISAFRREVKDLIRWADADGDLVLRPENVERALVAGWEAEVVYRPSPGLSLPIGYQRLQSEDETTGERIPGSVRSLWRAALQSTGGTFTWSIEYAVTDRGDYPLRDGAWRSAVVNAALAWNQRAGSFPIRVSLRGENLQDRNHESVDGYPMPGRSWFAEVRVGL